MSSLDPTYVPDPATDQRAQNGSLPLRIAVALGDPERERAILPALIECGEFEILARCLAADDLLAVVHGGQVDGVLVAFDLHRLTDAARLELGQARVPVVMLSPSGGNGEGRAAWGITIPLMAEPEAVIQALLRVIAGTRPSVPRPISAAEQTAPLMTSSAKLRAPSTMVVVASGHGAPGRTVLAVNLAAALGVHAPTVLVDADLTGPSVSAYVDADPTRNLYLLAHAAPKTAREWQQALGRETQPLSTDSPKAAVLCGLPRPEMRRGISEAFFARLCVELRTRYRHVVVDIGADLYGAGAALSWAALAQADQVMLVAAADLVGLWHARSTLLLLRTQLQAAPERVALVINQYDPRHHHGQTEIEWALGTPVTDLIPLDHRSLQRALAAQQPVVFYRRSKAAQGLRDLAERIEAGTLYLPNQPRARPWTGRWRTHLARFLPAASRNVGISAARSARARRNRDATGV